MALELLHKATQLDPEFASAFGGIAYSMYVHIIMGDSDDRETDLQRGLEAGLTAVSLDDRDPFSHVGLGRLQIVRGEHEQAIASFNRALELNPSFALAHYAKGHSLWHCGHPDQSVNCLDEAMRLSPRDPMMWTFLASKAIALFMLERYDDALACAHRSQRHPVTAIWAHMAELATLGALERHDEAIGAMARALQIQPDLDMTFIRQALPVTHTASAEHFYGGLIKAGVPK